MHTTLKDQSRPTLEALEARLIALGETPCGCWENDDHVYAFSARSTPGTYGHAAVTLHWSHGFYTEHGDIRSAR